MSPELSGLSDGELATLTLGGRDAAFAEIMRRYRYSIFRLARAHTGDFEEALDITQDCFTAAYRNLSRYDSARPLRAWLSRIAINRSRDWRRKQRVREFFFPTSALPHGSVETIVDEAPGAEAIVSDRLQLDRLNQAIAELPRGMREVLLLRTIEGLSQAETAEALGISVKAVETRLHRARVRLAGLFSPV